MFRSTSDEQAGWTCPDWDDAEESLARTRSMEKEYLTEYIYM